MSECCGKCLQRLPKVQKPKDIQFTIIKKKQIKAGKWHSGEAGIIENDWYFA